MFSPRARTVVGLLLVALLIPIVVVPWREAAPPAYGPPATTAPPGAVGPKLSVDPANVSVAVSPGGWRMSSGDSVNLSASLVGVPGDCTIEFDWFDWFLQGPSFDEGFLNASAGTAVRATALPGAAGPLVVQVLGTTGLQCSGYTDVVRSVGTMLIELLPRLAIPSVSLAPDPAPPGDLVTVRWDIAGGVGPYSLDVEFGDGSNTTVPQAAPGSGFVFHRFPSGEYAPQVTATDARGVRIAASDPTPMVSDAALAVSLTPATAGPEVGRVFQENGSILGGVGPVHYTWSLNGTAISSGQVPEVPALTFTPRSPGPLTVALTAIDGMRENGSATANLTVAPPLSFGIDPVRSGGDVGRPVLLNVTVSGGSAPFAILWTLLPDGSAQSATLPSDGPHVVAVVPSAPGPLLLAATMTDAAGAVATGSFDLGNVGEGPSAALAVPGAPVEAGVPMDLGLQIVGGAGPFDWSIEPSVGVGGAPTESGVVPQGAPVNWSAVPTAPGALVVTALVVDAFGGFAETNRSIPVIDALSLTAVVSNGSESEGPSLTVFADVGGGVPPYSLEATVDGTTVALQNLSTAGGYTLRIASPPAGFDAIHLVARDALGINVTRTSSTFVSPVGVAAPTPLPAAAPPAASAPLPLAAASGAVLLLGAVAGGFWWLRRRALGRPPPAGGSPASRALGLVRRSLADGEGMDAEMLTVLAEEEGIPGPSVEAALRQWERLGRIRRETDPVGGELLHWNPGASVRAPSEETGDAL